MTFARKENEVLLIKAFKKGNPEAFEDLFKMHHKRLFYFLYGLLRSKEDAEEIVQDAFIKIWEKRSDFNEEYTFEAFLFKIAKNAFLNYNRKKINRKIFEENFGILHDLSSNNTEEYVLFKETRYVIDNIIAGLPPKRKQIFLFRRVEGLSRQEIAEKLNISIITVDGQLMKANKYLKEEFKKYSLFFVILFMNL